MSPALIAEYQTHLPQKALLTNKLRELRELAEAEGFAEDEEDENDWDVLRNLQKALMYGRK